MGLRKEFEKIDIITDEDIARGIVYAWTAMVVADARVEQSELIALEKFTRIHNITQQFNQGEWLSDTVGEALNVFKAEGVESLFSVIEELLDNSSAETKRILLYTLMHLACVDGDFAERELDFLEKIIHCLDIDCRDVLMMGTLFATYKPRS